MLRGDNSERYGWLIGGGLISLSAAVYMIRDGKMKGENIHIFEETGRYSWNDQMPGNEEIFRKPLSGYKSYTYLTDLLTEIPSVANRKLSARDELVNFNKKTGNISLTDRPDNQNTIINQYHSILLSLREWIKSRGGTFYPDASVEKLEFQKYADTNEKAISAIVYKQDSEKEKVNTGFEDLIIIGTEYNTEAIPEKCHNLVYFNSSLLELPTMEETVSKARKVVYQFLGIDE